MIRLLHERPVVVTGIGAFSTVGPGAPTLSAAAMAGRSPAQARDFVCDGSPPSECFVVCAAPMIDATHPELHPVRKMDRCVQMAFLAVREAWQQAGLDAAYPPERIGIVVGSSRGPLSKCADNVRRTGNRAPMPSLAADTAFASVSGALARAFKIKGPGAMVSATCASAAFAVAWAAEQIVMGNADAMLVGGTEAPLHPSLLAQLQSAGVLGFHAEPERTCRPFDVDRNGLVLGEGSAFLVLEAAPAATVRSVPVLACLAGWATGIDDSGRVGVNPQGSGLRETMKRALRMADQPPDEIDYINAHGTGTRLNDAAEARAVHDLFGGKVPCTSTKPVTGHCLGATPALEAVLCVETLRLQTIAPTANCQTQDPDCPINVVPGKAQPATVSAVMSNSSGFWGYHASLVFRARDSVA